MKTITSVAALLLCANVAFAEPNAYEQCVRDAQIQAVNPWQLRNLQDLCATDYPKEAMETFQKQMKTLGDALCKEDPNRFHCKKKD